MARVKKINDYWSAQKYKFGKLCEKDAAGWVHLEVLDGVLMALALLNTVQGQLALQVPVDPEVDVLASIVVGAHLDEEVRAGDHLALVARGVEVAQLATELSLHMGPHLKTVRIS